jgi:hypothetical protein
VLLSRLVCEYVVYSTLRDVENKLHHFCYLFVVVVVAYPNMMTGSNEPQSRRARHDWKLGGKLWLLLYQMLLWLKQSWSVHVTSVTIKNCWRKSGLLDMGEPENSSDSATEAFSDAMSALEQAAHAQHFMLDDEAFERLQLENKKQSTISAYFSA